MRKKVLQTTIGELDFTGDKRRKTAIWDGTDKEGNCVTVRRLTRQKGPNKGVYLILWWGIEDPGKQIVICPLVNKKATEKFMRGAAEKFVAGE